MLESRNPPRFSLLVIGAATDLYVLALEHTVHEIMASLHAAELNGRSSHAPTGNRNGLLLANSRSAEARQ